MDILYMCIMRIYIGSFYLSVPLESPNNVSMMCAF